MSKCIVSQEYVPGIQSAIDFSTHPAYNVQNFQEV